MSNFQLTDGTRLWAWEDKDERIAIHTGNEIDLELLGSMDSTGKPLKIQLDKQGVVDLKLVASPGGGDATLIARQRFTLKSLAEGSAQLTGVDSTGKVVCGPLKVFAGEFKNFEGMEKDLLAEVGRGSNPKSLYLLQRFLNNNYDHLFNQFNDASVGTHHSPLACGKVAKAGGDALLGKVVSHSYEKDSSYHKTMSGLKKRSDIKYDADLMTRVRRILAGHIRNGKPCLVGCTYEPKQSMLKEGHLQATRDGGHSVLLVGCDKTGSQFLYVDPFPGGSNMKYTGGIKSDSYPPQCFYLGVFHVDNTQEARQRGPFLRKHDDSSGPWLNDRYLEIISGPKR